MSDWHKIEQMVIKKKKFFVTFPSFNVCNDKIFNVVYKAYVYPLASIVGVQHPNTHDLIIGEVVQVGSCHVGIRFIFPSIPIFENKDESGLVHVSRKDIICKFVKVSERYVWSHKKV